MFYGLMLVWRDVCLDAATAERALAVMWGYGDRVSTLTWEQYKPSWLIWR